VLGQVSELLNITYLFCCMYRAYCTVYYPDKQMHNVYIYINNILYIVSTATCFDASASSSGSLILLLLKSYKNLYGYKPAYRKHQHKDHTYTTVQTVYTAIQLTVSMYCNYSSWQPTAFYRLYFIINCNIRCNHFNVLFYWVCNFEDFGNFSKVER